MKRFKGFNPMLFAAAVIFLCVTVYSLVSNVTVYVRQRNWPVTTATVIDVAENGKEYNITYQYEARGNVYTGKLHRVRLRYGFGETLAVRYDPDAPEKSVRQGAMTRRSILTQAGPPPPPRRRNPLFRCGSRASGRRPSPLPPCVCPGRSRRRALRSGLPPRHRPKNPGPPKEPSARRRSGRPRTGSSGRCANWCGTSRKSTRPWDTRCGWSDDHHPHLRP